MLWNKLSGPQSEPFKLSLILREFRVMDASIAFSRGPTDAGSVETRSPRGRL